MDFTITPVAEYEKPKKITRWSEGFHHTLQTLDTWRESEITGNGNNIRNFYKLEEFWQDPPITAIDHDLVERTLKRMRESTGNSNSTLNRAVSTIKKVLHQCARSGYLTHVPVIDKFKVEKGRGTPHWTKPQVERLIQLARERGDDPLAQAIETSAYSGLRKSELIRLKVWDVDFHKNVFLVGGTPESRTKGRNYRSVPIHPRLLPIMESRASSARPMNSYIFDEFTDKWHLRTQWDHVRERIQLEDRNVIKAHCWKSLRNSYITWALSQGTPLMTVKKWAGHSTVTVTEGYYDHNDAQDQAEAARM
tara:strand:- start:64 stop:984 length:921 start_codon:yes stop_codon:yes gene_type:complete